MALLCPRDTEECLLEPRELVIREHEVIENPPGIKIREQRIIDAVFVAAMAAQRAPQLHDVAAKNDIAPGDCWRVNVLECGVERLFVRGRPSDNRRREDQKTR